MIYIIVQQVDYDRSLLRQASVHNNYSSRFPVINNAIAQHGDFTRAPYRNDIFLDIHIFTPRRKNVFPQKDVIPQDQSFHDEGSLRRKELLHIFLILI